MARKLAAQKDRRQQSVQEGKHPQGVSKAEAQRPVRRSARLNPKCIEHTKCQHPLPSNKTLCREDWLTAPQSIDWKQIREVEYSVEETAPLKKLLRTSSVNFAVETQTGGGALVCDSETLLDPINYWRRQQTWPKKYFEPDSTINHLLARRKSTPSLRRKQSESGSLAASSATPSDQKPREEKSAPYKDARYPTQLETKGSFMNEDQEGPTKTSRDLCRNLLEEHQDVPNVSRFSDNIFKSTCRRIQNRNEAKIIQDITRLIVPSAEELADFGSEHLRCLVESVNEGWNNSIPVTKPRPQPDYSVGFKRTTFNEDQLNKLQSFIGDFLNGDLSFFMATFYMYFPFLTCEVKCGAAALDVADRQNAHSMTLAVRAIVELFRLVKREQQLHRQILAFSISHDHSSVRIYGHYPIIKGKDTAYYRYPIHKFDFTSLDGKEKWTAYKLTRNIYDTWAPMHLDRIRSVIDEIPADVDFEVSLLPEESRLSQDLESHHLSRSLTGPESGIVDVGDTTPDTSFTGQGASKRSRRNPVKGKR